MPKSSSGRIVIEVDPELKCHLYSVLALKNQTLKDWFIEVANNYLADQANGQIASETPSSQEKKL